MFEIDILCKKVKRFLISFSKLKLIELDVVD
jgi:hypothetical protein